MLPKPSNPCKACPLYGNGQGFVPASGTGDNGVLIVLEAAGENEVNEGMPVVGKAGYYLFQNLKRVGIEREGFRIHNVLSCRPPQNKLSRMPYEDAAIACCSPLLDATIAAHVQHCRTINKTPVIVTLGRIAFKRIMGLKEKDSLLREDYLCYPFTMGDCVVIAGDHPSYLMRGNSHLLPVMLYAFQRALDIADHGWTEVNPSYLLDPNTSTFSQWVDDYLKVASSDPSNVFLSYDIETPYKSGKNEERVAREDDDDYTILRCSFAYKVGEAVTVPWRAEYIPYLTQLFGANLPKVGWNNEGYDAPRIRHQMPLNGDQFDGMLAWHVLNSSLPKGLGFVTPFYAKFTSPWKHLSNVDMAQYNAKDADMALQNWIGIRRDLGTTSLGQVYQRHVIELNRVLAYMSQKGVLRDEILRADSEVKLQGLLDAVEARMVEAVPQDAKKLKVFKKTPKDTSGMTQVEGRIKCPVCPKCATVGVKADHFKSVGKKALKAGVIENPCVGSKSLKLDRVQMLWAKPLPWKVSKVGLSSYQKSLKHAAIRSRESKVTFDEDAIKKLVIRYPKDALYPAILEHRKYQKLLSVYVGTTVYEDVIVPDDYVLKPGERFKDEN